MTQLYHHHRFQTSPPPAKLPSGLTCRTRATCPLVPQPLGSSQPLGSAVRVLLATPWFRSPLAPQPLAPQPTGSATPCSPAPWFRSPLAPQHLGSSPPTGSSAPWLRGSWFRHCEQPLCTTQIRMHAKTASPAPITTPITPTRAERLLSKGGRRRNQGSTDVAGGAVRVTRRRDGPSAASAVSAPSCDGHPRDCGVGRSCR